MSEEDIKFIDVNQGFTDYLRDESRHAGNADTISFPVTEEELKQHLAKADGQHLTIQGARTGIAGGAVPGSGHIINLSRMKKILNLRKSETEDCYLMTVQPGVLLTEIRDKINSETDGKYFFPPDPTETSAAISGMVACNSSGARSFFYGSTRKYIERLKVVLPNGSTMDLRRGKQKINERKFSIETDSGQSIEGTVPSYEMPAVKNASGYFSKMEMDTIDLFIGSEGTLGIISEIEIKLIPSPLAIWGLMIFLPSEESALKFVRKTRDSQNPDSDRYLAAIEFFDNHSLTLLAEQKKNNPAFSEVPELPENCHSSIYVECHGPSDDAVEEAITQMAEIMIEFGGDDETTWIATDEKEMDRFKSFRHAIPEAVNLLIDERKKTEPTLTKLGTDLAVPDNELETVFKLYHSDLDDADLEYVIFGHIGNNHVHVNILPRNLEDYERGKELYLRWARKVIAMGGTVSAEHGIGKLKTALLKEMYGEQGIQEMINLKKSFDPCGILSSGNLFNEEIKES